MERLAGVHEVHMLSNIVEQRLIVTHVIADISSSQQEGLQGETNI